VSDTSSPRPERAALEARCAGIPLVRGKPIKFAADFADEEKVLSTHPALKRALVIGGGLLLAVVGFAVLLQLASRPWPFAHTSLTLIALATALLVMSLFFRISGWQQLFHLTERPDRAACFTSAGGAAIASSVLPAKLDYVVKVWLLRRLSKRRFAVQTAVFSLCALALVDAVVLVPPAATGVFAIDRPEIRIPLMIVMLIGLGCAAALIAGSRIERLPLVRRVGFLTRAANSLGKRRASHRENLVAFLLLNCSLWLRAGALMIMLFALSVSFSITTALVFICLTAGSAFVPIPSFGPAAGTAALSGLGLGLANAATFALAVTMLSVLAAAISVVLAGVWYLSRSQLAKRSIAQPIPA
jgi:hypothetical protein